ncbi:MAG: hypothetical protein LBC61_05080 [Candidatus Peribacteria bacterium]|nr:hypothetical protein [Candidatus Peribacteria bacterium]
MFCELSSSSSRGIFNFFVFCHLLLQYFLSQSKGCPDIARPIISFS